MSTNWLLDKKTGEYSPPGILLRRKKEWDVKSHNIMDESQKQYLSEDSQDTKSFTQFYLIYMNFKTSKSVFSRSWEWVEK